jgi:tRNA(Ile)-lysidine synthase
MQLEQLQTKWSFLSSHKVFVGCSGGVDSVVLLVALKSFCPDLEVLHVNYSLRGVESDTDEQFVRELCSSLGITFHVKKVDTPAILNASGGNLQEVARNIRYAFFQEQLSKHAESIVALGQHADDQVETFFQHLARKSGILGMSCMLENHERFVRPLLPFSKNEILAFAKANSIQWREDQSNHANKYTRNRIRNILLPHLYTEIPSLKDSVLTLVNAFQETQKHNSLAAEKVIAGFVENRLWLYADFDGLTEDIRLEVIRFFGGDYSVYAQLVKIRNVQKGKWVVCGKYKIYKESIGFSFVISNKEIEFSLKTEYVTTLPSVFTKEIVYLDPTKVEGELVLRVWEQGDRISPLGMKGSKLISDVLTEAKVFSSERERCMVLVDDNSLLWCVGFKVSRKAIADTHCQNILKVQIVEK